MAFDREVVIYDTVQNGKAIIQVPKDRSKIKGGIIFLHGVGEIAAKVPIEGVEKIALPYYLKTKPNLVPQDYFYLIPQCTSSTWSEHICTLVMKLFDQLCLQYGVTDERHCTGLSLGGRGTFDMARYSYKHNGNKAGYFKTYGVVCGWGDSPLQNDAYYPNARWKIWHGTADSDVVYQRGYTLFGNISGSLAEGAQFKAYRGAGHSIWNTVYDPIDSNVDGYFQWLKPKPIDNGGGNDDDGSYDEGYADGFKAGVDKMGENVIDAFKAVVDSVKP